MFTGDAGACTLSVFRNDLIPIQRCAGVFRYRGKSYMALHISNGRHYRRSILLGYLIVISARRLTMQRHCDRALER